MRARLTRVPNSLQQGGTLIAEIENVRRGVEPSNK